MSISYTDDTQEPPIRKCLVCGKPLSKYNRGDRCFHHPDEKMLLLQQKKEEREAEKARLQEEAERLTNLEQEEIATLENEKILQELIFGLVCEEFLVSKIELLVPSRKTRISDARQVLMYLLYIDTSLSYKDIGDILGKDHSTIIHGVQKIKRKLMCDDELANRIKKVQSSYKQHGNS